MCGSATLTMVVSSTWISVADITANVMKKRTLLAVFAASTSAVAAVLCSAMRRLRFRCHRHQNAAGGAIQQCRILGVTPPARQAAALAMAHHDQVHTQLARGGVDA